MRIEGLSIPRTLLLLLDGTVTIKVTYNKIESTPTKTQAKLEIKNTMEEGTTSVADGDGDDQSGMIIGITIGGVVLVLMIVILVFAKCYNMPCTPCEPCAPFLCSVCSNNNTPTPDTTTLDNIEGLDDVMGQNFHTSYIPNTNYRGCSYQHCSQCQYT